MDPAEVRHISEKPWSAYTEADYTIEQWHAACLVHLHDGPPTSKSQCKLPVKTPNGALNRNGVHAAAAALAGARAPLKAPPEQKAKAANALRRYYSQLGETPPDSLKQSAIDDVLAHIGVKGMKWGVRRERTSGNGSSKPTRAERRIAKQDRKLEKTIASKRRQNQLKIELHNSIQPVVQSKVHQMNAKPEWVKAAQEGKLKDPNSPESKKYVKEYNKMYMDEMNGFLKGYTSASGRRVTAVQSEEDYIGFKLQLEEAPVKHAEGISFRVEYVRDDQGRIIGFEIVDDEMTQSEEAVQNVLAHFGVKGMKWGVRRKATVDPKEIIVRDTRSRLPTWVKEPRVKTRGGKELPAHTEAVRARTIGQKRKGSGLKTLSDQELRDYANRLQLEQNVKRLEYNELSPGKKFIRRLTGQSMQNAANSASKELGKKALAAAALA